MNSITARMTGLEMVVMVWRVLRVVEPVAPLVPDFLTGGMGGLWGTAMP